MKDVWLADNPLCTLRVSIADMVALGVRMKGPQNTQLPEALYQAMPAKAMALISTLPSGTFSVSIPGGSAGYPILQTPPPYADGFVVVYAYKPNSRYEAVHVQYKDKPVELDEFVQIAQHWVEQHPGKPKTIPGRYAYFAPTRDEWGVILRDSGFMAWDPSTMPGDASPELGRNLEAPNSSGIVARIPVYAGAKAASSEILRVFAQVEVTPDPNPHSQSVWIGFAEYMRQRTRRSSPPDSIVPDFREWLIRLTEESGFEYWVFHAGMMFGDCMEWWGDCCRRRTQHEGIDFVKGVRPGNGICSIPEGVPIRSIANGEVVALFDDFLGKTVVVRHPAITGPGGDVYHTFLSHIQPLIGKRDSVTRGQVIGRMGKSTNPRVPAHLHVTGAWLPKNLAPDSISLDHIHPAFAPATLSDFKSLVA